MKTEFSCDAMFQEAQKKRLGNPKPKRSPRRQRRRAVVPDASAAEAKSVSRMANAVKRREKKATTREQRLSLAEIHAAEALSILEYEKKHKRRREQMDATEQEYVRELAKRDLKAKLEREDAEWHADSTRKQDDLEQKVRARALALLNAELSNENDKGGQYEG